MELRPYDTARHRLAEEDEAELAALGHQQARAQGRRRAEAEQTTQDEQHGPLHRNERGHEEEDAGPAHEEQAEIDRHADRDEEQAEQEAFVGSDFGRDLVTEGRAGEQHAHHEAAERRRQPGPVRHPSRQHDGENGQDRECLHVPVAGGPGEQPGQDDVTEDADCGQRRQRQGDPLDQGDRVRIAATGPEKRHEGDDWHDHHVLQQKDGEGGATMLARELAALGQELGDEGGRGEGESQAEDERRLPGPTARQGNHHQGGAGQGHLQAAEAEQHPPHGP